MQLHFQNIVQSVLRMLTLRYSISKQVFNRGEYEEIFLFISPNSKENMSQNEALEHLEGSGQNMIRTLVSGMAELDGRQVDLLDAIGEWSDGVENSLIAIWKSGIDAVEAKAYAAATAKAALQKAYVLFLVSDKHQDLLLSLVSTDTHTLSEVRQMLRKSGIGFSTIVDRGTIANLSSFSVFVCCPGNECRTPFHVLADNLDIKHSNIDERNGLYEYLGFDSREEAQTGFSSQINDIRKQYRRRSNFIDKQAAIYTKAITNASSREQELLRAPIITERSQSALDRIFGVSNLDEKEYLRLLFTDHQPFIYNDGKDFS